MLCDVVPVRQDDGIIKLLRNLPYIPAFTCSVILGFGAMHPRRSSGAVAYTHHYCVLKGVKIDGDDDCIRIHS